MPNQQSTVEFFALFQEIFSLMAEKMQSSLPKFSNSSQVVQQDTSATMTCSDLTMVDYE
jgi:hypothetical protein